MMSFHTLIGNSPWGVEYLERYILTGNKGKQFTIDISIFEISIRYKFLQTLKCNFPMTHHWLAYRLHDDDVGMMRGRLCCIGFAVGMKLNKGRISCALRTGYFEKLKVYYI